jgi:hypothetical protein
MEELSDFNYLLGRPQIMRLEVEAAIDATLGTTDTVGEGEGISLIGQSAFWAFGMRGGLIIEGEERQEAEQRLRYRLGDQRFEQMMAHFNREAERYSPGQTKTRKPSSGRSVGTHRRSRINTKSSEPNRNESRPTYLIRTLNRDDKICGM